MLKSNSKEEEEMGVVTQKGIHYPQYWRKFCKLLFSIQYSFWYIGGIIYAFSFVDE